MTDDITIGVATHEDWDSRYEMVSTAFNSAVDEADSAVERSVFEPDRWLIARRQRVLTRLMRQQFADIRDAGESIAVL